MLRSGSVSASPVLEIGELRIDRSAAVVTVDGATLALGMKVVATLSALHERAGEVVLKATLIERVWGDAPVDESSLWQNVHVLRGVLKRHAPGTRIETVKGRGYRLIMDVVPVIALEPAFIEAGPSEAEPVRVPLVRVDLHSRRRVPGWLWSIGGAAAAALVFGIVHVVEPAPHVRPVLVLIAKPGERLPALPPLPGDGEQRQIVLNLKDRASN